MTSAARARGANAAGQLRCDTEQVFGFNNTSLSLQRVSKGSAAAAAAVLKQRTEWTGIRFKTPNLSESHP